MSRADQEHWNDRYRDGGRRRPALKRADLAPPADFERFADRLIASKSAIEIACGTGATSLWLAASGVDVVAYDVSSVAIGCATQQAADLDLQDSCSFEVLDLDGGLPTGDRVDLVVCHMFRDASLDASLKDRLNPGGLVAIACLSEVGATPGRFRAVAGELRDAFNDLDILGDDEAGGVAWLVGQAMDG